MGVNVILTFKVSQGMAKGFQNQLVSTVKIHTSTFKILIRAQVHTVSEITNHSIIIEEWETAQNYKACNGL